jgi:hypothetical protein
VLKSDYTTDTIKEELGDTFFANFFAKTLADALSKLRDKCLGVERDLQKRHTLLREIIGEQKVTAMNR